MQLGPQGNQLARFQPPLRPGDSFAFHGFAPDDVAVTPDGSKVAYTVYGYSCVPGVSCGSRQMTGYVSGDGTASLGYELRLTGPEWISSDTVLGFGFMFRQVVFDSIDTGMDDAVLWFNDPEDVGLRDGELSPQGSRLAALRGDLLVDGATVASGSAALEAGKGTVTFRFTKRARRRLARRKAVTLEASLVFRAASGAVVPVTGSVEVRR